MKKNGFGYLRAAALAAVALSLSSCAWYDSGVPPYGYGGTYAEDYDDYYDGPGYPSSRYYGPAYGSFTTGYYSSYGRTHYLCPVCHHNPCTCSHGHGDHYDHDHHNGHVDTGNLRVVGGSTGGKAKPQGEHSLDWYKSRGYDPKKLKLADPQGDVYHRSSSSNSHSSSSSHKSSSSSSHSKSSGGGSSSHSKSKSSSHSDGPPIISARRGGSSSSSSSKDDNKSSSSKRGR